MRGKYFKWVVICLIASLLSGTAAFYYMREFMPETFSVNGSEEQGQDLPDNEKTSPYPEWDKRNRMRALAVIIDNAEPARPQSGLDKAEVILEVPVEGGLSRLVAVMTGDGIDTIGPIRSARPYMVDLAREYNAILIHAGGSQEALDQIARDKVNHLDEISGGTQVASAFWRLPDRQKPHNLYASLDSLRRAGTNLKYNMTVPYIERPFLDAGEEAEGEIATDITIYYPNRDSEIRYLLNKEKMVYERYMAEKPHLNADSQQLACANVIVQFVPYRNTDGDGRMQLVLHGEGRALVFREGKVTEATWKKPPLGFTRFTDKKGEEIPLVKGPAWIVIVKNGTRVDY